MSEDLERSAELIESLLGDPELRRRFRSDAAAVLVEAGLPGLASGLGRGQRALMTLELRESRSSLAGVMVAAAAEAVDFAQMAEHAAPALAHDASGAMQGLIHPKPHAPEHVLPGQHAAPSKPAPAAAPSLGPPAAIPRLDAPPHVAHPEPAAGAATPSDQAGAAPGGSRPAVAPSSSASASGSAPGSQVTGSTGGDFVPSRPPVNDHSGVPSGTPAHDHHSASGSSPSDAALPEPSTAGSDYPGDQASPEQLAAWMGAHAQQAGLPPELPVMAALTESGLHNLSYGDRDSVGFFQMRVGIWNTGAYAGYPDQPGLQLQWFIDHALAVKAQDPALTENPSTWGEWVANIEQPAAQYRYRYQLQLGTAQELLHGAPAPAGATPAEPAGATPAEAPAPVVHAPPVPAGQGALKVALHYVDGGSGSGASLHTGVDSSQLVQLAYARQGVQLPGVAAEQYDVGMPVSRGDLHPGDAVFFAEPSGYIRRVGLYVGDGRFVSASETGGEVRISSLSDPGFADRYAGARRYTAGALGNPSSYARTMPTVKP